MPDSKFTFCIPNLNKIDFLPACIQSMLAQDSDTWCCVFVDGYSTDGSWEYMQQFADDPRFTLLRGKRQGMYEDWNYCLEQVNTEYFYFLTSDDLCYPQLISKTTQVLDQHHDVDACHFKFEYINEHNQVTRRYEDIIAAEMPVYLDSSGFAHRRSALFETMMHFVYRTIYRTMTSLVLRRSTISEVGQFSSQFGSAGDYDWTLRLSMHTDVLFIPETLTAWRKYEGQATQSPHSLESNKRILDIAERNFIRFQEVVSAQQHHQAPNQKLILSCLTRDYEFSLYDRLYELDDLTEKLNLLVQAFTAYPLHYLNALLKRFNQFPIYSYLNKEELVSTLIHDYQLQWPPQPIQSYSDNSYQLKQEVGY